MDYKEFVDEFSNKLQERMDDGVEIVKTSSVKVNEELEGLSIRYPDSSIAPMVYTDDKYQMYQEGIGMDELVDRTTKALEDMRDNCPEIPIINKEEAEKNLYCVVVNSDENKKLLEKVPHEKLEDLAVIPRFRVDDNSSFIVTNNVCDTLKMTSEEIMEAAHANTNAQKFDCINMNDIIREMMEKDGLSEEYIDEIMSIQGQDNPMYVISNESRFDGAVAITSKEAMEKAYEKVKEDHPEMKDMYVIGSSRHELILLADSTVDSIDALKDIHKDVQDTTLDKADKLTDHVYKYNSESKEISIADKVPSMSEELSNAMDKTESHGRSH